MKLEEQVTSLELSKRLKELGFKQESLFWWCESVSKEYLLEYYVFKPAYEGNDCIPAYTVAELGEMLLNRYNMRYFYANASPEMKWATMTDALHGEYGKTMADSMAKMLIYLKENNLI